MPSPPPEPPEVRPWIVTLAGGTGRRLSGLVDGLEADGRPKHFCSFWQERSLLQRARARADRLTPPDRQIVVGLQDHRPWFREQLETYAGHLILQPSDRGTLPALYAALVLIRRLDGDAPVLVQPADGFSYPEEHLAHQLARMAAISTLLEGRILVGALPPARPDARLVWLLPGEPLGTYGDRSILWVDAVLPHPSPRLARRLTARGSLVCAGFLAGSTRTFWRIARRDSRYMLKTLWNGDLVEGDDGSLEPSKRVFESVPRRDIEAGILQGRGNRLACMPLRGFLWGDWDTEEDIEQSLSALTGESGPRPMRSR